MRTARPQRGVRPPHRRSACIRVFRVGVGVGVRVGVGVGGLGGVEGLGRIGVGWGGRGSGGEWAVREVGVGGGGWEAGYRADTTVS